MADSSQASSSKSPLLQRSPDWSTPGSPFEDGESVRQELRRVNGDIQNIVGEIIQLKALVPKVPSTKSPPTTTPPVIIDGKGTYYSGGEPGCTKRMMVWIDRHYLIIVIVGFSFNFALWMCMMFLVFKMEKNKEWWYNAASWAIFLVVVLLVLALFWWKLLSHPPPNETSEAAEDSHPNPSDQSVENGRSTAFLAEGSSFERTEPAEDNGRASACRAESPSPKRTEPADDNGKANSCPAEGPSPKRTGPADDNGKANGCRAEGPSLKRTEPAGENDSNAAVQRGRFRFLARIASIVTELLSFTMVIVYFYTYAVPLYNSPTWDLEVDIHDSIELPAVAVIGNYGDAVSATLDQHWLKCFFPNYTSDNSTSCAKALNPTAQPLNTARYGQTQFYDFNVPGNLYFTTESKEMLLQTRFTWNSTAIEANYGSEAEFNPSLYVILYDSRISADGLCPAIDCGLLSWTEIPALGSNTLTITVTRTFDILGKIDTTRLNNTCGGLASKMYSHKDPAYSTYEFDISSSGATNETLCDVGKNEQAKPCISQLLLRYQTFSVTSLTSLPGIRRKDILINEGAIVGAVAFFLMFFAFFADYDPVLESFNPMSTITRRAAQSSESV